MNNQLTSLDISKNTGLVDLACSDNNLTDLDISANPSLKTIYIRNISSLARVCVWELPFPPEGIKLDTTGSPNVFFVTDCGN